MNEFTSTGPEASVPNSDASFQLIYEMVNCLAGIILKRSIF